MVAPIVEEIAAEQAGKMLVGKLNIDEQQEVAFNYRVKSIPTLILFKAGRPAETIVGAMPKAALMSRLSPHLS
jgi:thioredoxin-like negative regulator of GroEL